MMSVNALKYKGELLAEDNALLAKSPGILGEYKELRADALEADTLDLTVVSESGTIRNFKKNDKVEYFRAGLRRGVYYLQSVTRVGPKLYRLSALSAVGLLIARPHRGGIYTGQTVAEVVADLCGDVPVLIETVYRGVRLYGWLPIATARDNLAQVLFAIGAWLHTDENGVLRVQKLWNGTASIIGADRVHAANIQLKYLDPVSAVAVTEHQYIAGAEEVKLFEGTAQQGDVIEFDEPAHSLTADGFAILESGANYAVLSAGTGTLTGKKYIHNMRVVTRTVTEGAAENVEEVRDATLVSLVNSSAVAKRMAEYYACRDQIAVDVVPTAERTGHVVELWNEWDKRLVSACIASRDTKVSGLLKSRTSALVGFLPPQPESTEYFDERVILTGSGEWTVPEGVTSYTRVLIGGGRGGNQGNQGGQSKPQKYSWSQQVLHSAWSYTTYIDAGGAGGLGGSGGEGGNVLVETIIDAVPGTKIPYACGVGERNTARSNATTMGGSTSDTGSSSEAGYSDPITGEVFAGKGKQGIAGGNGSGIPNNQRPPANGWDVPSAAQSVTDENGRVWAGGSTMTDDGSIRPNATESSGAAYGASTYNFGGGAAAGANGIPGTVGGKVIKSGSTITVSCADGTNGADATLVPNKPSVYGQGGRGGYGGGGAGAAGIGEVGQPVGGGATLRLNGPSASGRGGFGGPGGPGGDGCIIIYYRKLKPLSAGWLRDNTQKPLLDRLGRRLIV